MRTPACSDDGRPDAVQLLDRFRSRRWPTIGRDHELGLLNRVADRVAAGRGALVLVTGPAGAGKSHLLERAFGPSGSALVGPAAGVDVRRVRLPESSLSVPFAPFLDAFGTSMRSITGSTTTASGSRSMIEAGAGDVATVVVVERLLEHIDQSCRTRPLVVVLDDAHLADPGSLAVLDQLTPRVADLALALVIAARPAVVGSGFDRWVDRASGHLETLELGSLGLGDLELLVEALVGVPPGPRLREVLAATGGSPLLATALLESILPGEVVTNSEQLEIEPDVHERLMARAPDAVVRRIAEVPGDVRRALLAAAVLGDPFHVGRVADLLGVPLGGVLDAFEYAERSGLVDSDGPSSRFRHELYRQAVLGTASSAVTASLHGAAAALAMQASETPFAVAEHLIAAGRGGPETVDWLVRAAESVVSFEPTAALRMTEQALRSVTDPDRRLRTVRVRALASVGRVAEAEAELRGMLARAVEPDDEAALRRELALALFQQGRPNESLEEMRRVAALADGAARRARAGAEMAFTLLLAARFSEADAVASAAMETARDLGDLTTEAAAAMVLTMVRWYVLRHGQAVTLADRIEAIAGLPAAADAAVYQPWFASGLVRVELDDHVGARRIASAGRRRCVDSGYLWMVPGYDALAAYCSLRAGELDDAVAEATAALDWGIEDRLGVAVWCHAFIARASVHQGDLDRADAALDRADRLIQQERAQLGWDHVGIARAQLAERRGDLDAALRSYLDVWDLHVALGVYAAVQESAPEIVRLGVLTGNLDRLPEVLDGIDAAATAVGDPTRLADRERAHGWWHRDPDRLSAAVAHQSATVRRLATARTRADLALVLADRGERSAAIREAVTARVELEHCGAFGDAATLGPLVGARPGPGGHGIPRLSRSEHRVVELVAEGLSNAQIAERLVVSRRTVESHVSAAYRKLGVSNRVELARRAIDLGPG